MPIYEYSCQACRGEFEELVLSNDTAVCCPYCHSTRTHKRMSSFSCTRAGSAGAAPSSASSCSGCTSKKCSTCR